MEKGGKNKTGRVTFHGSVHIHLKKGVGCLNVWGKIVYIESH